MHRVAHSSLSFSFTHRIVPSTVVSVNSGAGRIWLVLKRRCEVLRLNLAALDVYRYLTHKTCIALGRCVLKGALQRPLSLFQANADCKEDLQPAPPDSERAAQVHGIAPFLVVYLVAPCLAAMNVPSCSGLPQVQAARQNLSDSVLGNTCCLRPRLRLKACQAPAAPSRRGQGRAAPGGLGLEAAGSVWLLQIKMISVCRTSRAGPPLMPAASWRETRTLPRPSTRR